MTVLEIVVFLLLQLVENGSIMESHSSRLNVEDESSNKLDRIRQQGQRKLHNILSFVSEKLSSVSKKKLQLSDLVMQDHIPDMRLVLFKAAD